MQADLHWSRIRYQRCHGNIPPIIVLSSLTFQSHFSSSPMDMPSPLGRMMRRVACLTSGQTRSWPCTATTTSSAASPVSPSPSRGAFCWRDTMTLIAMSGTR